jgi:DNA-binding protein WhiA
MLHFSGYIGEDGAGIQTENEYAARFFESALSKFAECEVLTLRLPGGARGGGFKVLIREKEQILRLLNAVRMEEAAERGSFADLPLDGMLVQKSCCRKAFLRAVFLLAGSVNNPEKSYHFEIVCQKEEDAEFLAGLMNSLSLDARIIPRKRRLKQQLVVYLKEGEQISDALGLMGAHQSLMKLENARIVRNIAGTVNRRVNCETANLMKTVDASVRQTEDIRYLRDSVGLEQLPQGLREAAELRLKMPDATLRELGEALDPPIGRSGVNHRLQRLSELAARLRGEEQQP